MKLVAATQQNTCSYLLQDRKSIHERSFCQTGPVGPAGETGQAGEPGKAAAPSPPLLDFDDVPFDSYTLVPQAKGQAKFCRCKRGPMVTN